MTKILPQFCNKTVPTLNCEAVDVHSVSFSSQIVQFVSVLLKDIQSWYLQGGCEQ